MNQSESTSGTVVIERVYDAPVEKVWQALTSPEALTQWFFDIQKFKAEIGFQFQFMVEHEGFRYEHHCRVTEVVPLRRISYTWRYAGHEGDSLVTFELNAEGVKTRVKLTHSGLDTFPKLPAFAQKNFEAGWTDLVGTSLKEFSEARPPKAA